MSDRVLVAYASRHGSTAQIAEAIGAALRAGGLHVDVVPARDVRSLGGYRAVVLGSAVYTMRWRRDATRFLRANRGELRAMPVWLFSSGPVGEVADETAPSFVRATRPRRIEQLAQTIGAREHAVFGGAVAEEGGWIRAKMARGIAPELRDRRDFAAIEAWAKGVAQALGAAGEPAAAQEHGVAA